MSRQTSGKGSTNLIIGASVAAGIGLIAGLGVVLAIASQRPDAPASSANSASPSVPSAGSAAGAAAVDTAPATTVPPLHVEDAGPRVEVTRPPTPPKPTIEPIGRPARPHVGNGEPPPSQKTPPVYTTAKPLPPQPKDPAGF